MTIYISTDEHGRGVRHVTGFESRSEFLNYASEVLACNDSQSKLTGCPNIDTICDAMDDKGIGFGARHHQRISRVDAVALKNSGVRFTDCWALPV